MAEEIRTAGGRIRSHRILNFGKTGSRSKVSPDPVWESGLPDWADTPARKFFPSLEQIWEPFRWGSCDEEGSARDHLTRKDYFIVEKKALS